MGSKTIYVQVARHHLEEAKKSAYPSDTAPFALPGVAPPLHPYMVYGGSGFASSPMLMPPMAQMYMAAHGYGVPVVPPMPPSDIGVVVAALDHAETAQQRDNVLGEALFPLVQALASDPSTVPKITGMLLELKDQDVIKMLEDHDYCHYRVWTAQRTLFGTPAPASHVPIGMYGRSMSADTGHWGGSMYAAPVQPVVQPVVSPVPPSPPRPLPLRRAGSNPIATMVAGVVPMGPYAGMMHGALEPAMPVMYRSASAGSTKGLPPRRRRAQRGSIAE